MSFSISFCFVIVIMSTWLGFSLSADFNIGDDEEEEEEEVIKDYQSRNENQATGNDANSVEETHLSVMPSYPFPRCDTTTEGLNFSHIVLLINLFIFTKLICNIFLLI